MLCSRLLRDRTQKHGALYRAGDRVFQGLLHFYEWSLGGVLRHRTAMGVMFFAVLGATWILYQKVPKGFIPDGDNDQMQVNVQAAQGTSFYKMVEYQAKIAEIVRQDPDVDTFMTNAGGGGYGGGNNARFFVMLKPRWQRKGQVTAQQIGERLRPKVTNIPGFNVFLSLIHISEPTRL